MTTTTMTHAEGRELAIARKRFRREVAMGRASWTDRLPAHPEMAQGAPVAPVRQPLAGKPYSNSRTHARKRFGEGLVFSMPSHRLDCTTQDLQWWAEQNAVAEDREVDRMYEAYRAQNRIESGWDC